MVRTPATSPDEKPARPGFWADDQGAVFVEFIITLYAFLFLLLGVLQIGLMVCASFYVNYANFMALRTAAVWYDARQDNLISDGDFQDKCKAAALHALGPMERYHWKHPDDAAARAEALGRIRFITAEGSGQYDGRCKTLTGRLEYDYYLIIPFVGRVMSGLAKNAGYIPSAEDDKRVGRNFAFETEGLGTHYPTVTLRSNNDLGAGASPRPHELAVQRRWKYATVQ